MRHSTTPPPQSKNPSKNSEKYAPHREKSNAKHIGNSAHTTEVGKRPNKALQAYFKHTSAHPTTIS